MASVKTKKGRHWDVDGDGCAVVITPGIPTAKTEKVPAKRIDREITRAGRRKAQAIAALAQAQADVDEWEKLEADMVALRATVTTEP